MQELILYPPEFSERFMTLYEHFPTWHCPEWMERAVEEEYERCTVVATED